MSDETKQKKSDSMREKYANGYISPKSKVVIELDENQNIINEWTSASKAGLFYNVNWKTITNIIEGKNSKKLPNKTFKFKYDT